MKFTIIPRKNIRSSCWRQRSKESPPDLKWFKSGGVLCAVAAGFFQKLGRLPFKCRRRVSGGIQRAETFKTVDIAVKVPLEDIRRHSKGRNFKNGWNCR